MRDIIIDKLNKSFDGKKVLSDFSTVLKYGEVNCIMGQSGCGKTTLLNIIMGIDSSFSGSISEIPRRIACVFQEDRLCEDFSALTNLRIVAANHAIKDDDIRNKCIKVLSELGLSKCMMQAVKTLSGGEKRRVAIGRALVFDSELIILDEAFKGLDSKTKLSIMQYVKQSCEGKTVIVVTHYIEEAEFFGGTIINM